jgi:acetylornithine deacetylase/succinyl-diaminopimelate desuccinylase-like protein
MQPVAAIASECTALMQKLISLPSVNPDQMKMAGMDLTENASICGESRVAEFLREQFIRCGATEAFLEDMGGSWLQGPVEAVPRPNVYGVWRSSNPDAKWLGIDAHIDTVMVTGMTPFEPFSGELTPDGLIHGRGSCDTKAAFASLLTLFSR